MQVSNTQQQMCGLLFMTFVVVKMDQAIQKVICIAIALYVCTVNPSDTILLLYYETWSLYENRALNGYDVMSRLQLHFM